MHRLIPYAGILIVCSIWIYRSSRRKITPSQKIVTKLYPKESRHLEDYIEEPKLDLMEKDRQLWQDFGGWDGFRRKRANANLFVHLCQSLPSDCEIHPDDIDFMAGRAMLINSNLFSALLVEAPMRLFHPGHPHYCARNTIQIYWEMERRITTLCGGDTLDHLHTML